MTLPEPYAIDGDGKTYYRCKTNPSTHRHDSAVMAALCDQPCGPHDPEITNGQWSDALKHWRNESC